MTEPTDATAAEPVPPPPPVTTDLEAQIKSLAAATGQDVAAVRAIVMAMDTQQGEAVGTVRVDPSTGAIAHRVMDRDVAKWLISHPTTGISYEMAPTKHDWELLAAPPTA